MLPPQATQMRGMSTQSWLAVDRLEPYSLLHLTESTRNQPSAPAWFLPTAVAVPHSEKETTLRLESAAH
jgi:hypothetical protein